ncbi:unnamed protein product, partial [Symbiodinium sp. CCMP2456]
RTASSDDALADIVRWTAISGRDDGIFVGGEFSGKGLHVDQRPESNLGKQWRGLKLFAAWDVGSAGQAVLERCYGEIFCPPLLAKHCEALKKCTQLFLLRPGDIFLFNGSMPHTALCIGESLNVTSYDGLLTWHPGHIEQFLLLARRYKTVKSQRQSWSGFQAVIGGKANRPPLTFADISPPGLAKEDRLELQRTLARCWPQLEGAAFSLDDTDVPPQPRLAETCRRLSTCPLWSLCAQRL